MTNNNLDLKHATLELHSSRFIALKLSDGNVILISAAENVSDENIEMMKALSGSDLSLIINNQRLNFIQNLSLDNKIYSITFDNGLNRQVCQKIAFANKAKNLSFDDMTIIPEPGFSIFSDVLKFLNRVQLIPAAVVCYVNNNEQLNFANIMQNNGFYSLKHEKIKNFSYNSENINIVARAKVPLKSCKNSEIVGFRTDLNGKDHFAIIFNGGSKIKEPLVRIHSQCITGDLLDSLKCDCGTQLDTAIKMLSSSSGVLLYLNQEGRDIGFVNKIRAYEIQSFGYDTIDANNALGFDDDNRDYTLAAKMLKLLKIHSIRLITNSPDKIKQLKNSKIKISEIIPLKVSVASQAKKYLETKKVRSGHYL